MQWTRKAISLLREPFFDAEHLACGRTVISRQRIDRIAHGFCAWQIDDAPRGCRAQGTGRAGKKVTLAQ